MNYRSTVVYLFAALVLLGIYLFETRRDEKTDLAREESTRVFRTEAARLERLTLVRGGERMILVKSGVSGEETWSITAPVSTGTDGFQLSRLKDRLADLRSLRIITENANDLSQFGLERPGFTIAFEAGEEKGSLDFGDKSPVEDAFYARKAPGNRVFLVGTPDKEALDKSLFDLRDKTLFSLDEGLVNRFVLERESGTWILNRKEGAWSLEGHEDLKIDEESLKSLVRRTLWLEAASFERERAEELEAFGLDRPGTRISLSDGRTVEEIAFGAIVKTREGERYYATLKGRPQIITVEKYFLASLPGSVEDLRKKEKKVSKSM